MVKLIESSQFADVPDIGVKFAEYGSPALTKEAENIFGCSYSSLKPPDDKYVGLHLTALGDEETYGCFFEGAPVLTPEGLKPIEEISVGDKVVTHTGTVSPVAKTLKDPYKGVRADITVTSLPDAISCTADHPVLVVTKKGLSPATRFKLRQAGKLADELDRRVATAEWVRADAIEEGDYLIIPTEYAKETLDAYQDIPVEFDPYACGYYLADGCLIREYRDISTKGEFKGALLTGSQPKTKVFDRLDAWLKSIGRTIPTRGRSYTSDIGIRYEIFYKDWAAWLDETFGHDGIVKHISPVVWKWSKEERLAFLAGYFDGDGCLIEAEGTRYHGTVTVNSASRSLLLDIQRLLASVGIASSVCRGMNRAANGCFGDGDHVIFALTIGAWYARELLKYTERLHPVEREFKQSGASSMQLGNRYALVRIDSVELSDVETTKYNLEVPGDNSYVVDVAVHNCNRNADSFPKEACVRYHDTFVKHGHVFSHHHNDAENDEILGVIKASAYNEKMGRIELFIWADKEKAKEGLDTLEKTGSCAFSMACRVPWDECFPKGTLVLTERGYVGIESIIPGDLVVSASDELREVLATSVKPAMQLSRVSVSGFPLDIECTPNHPFMIVPEVRMRGCRGSVNGKKRRHTFNGTTRCTTCRRTVDVTATWKPAGELVEGDYIKIALPRSTSSNTVGPSFAYMAGQYLGDGSFITERRGHAGDGEKRIMGISISSNADAGEHGIVDRVLTSFKTVSGKSAVAHVESCGRNAYKIDAYDQLTANRICSLCGAGSRTKFISREIETWSVEEKTAFLCGLIDADGCITRDKHAVRIITVNRGVALSVQRICWSLGIRATCYLAQRDGAAHGAFCAAGPVYGVQFSEFTGSMFKFSDKLSRHTEFRDAKTCGSTILLAEGYAYVRVTGSSTFDTDSRSVYNIEVADDHTYNAEGASVHNCSICHAHRKNSSDPNMCDHIRNQLGKVAENGKVAYMRNVLPDFFDISFVTRPADRIAYSLKVASESLDGVVTSEMLAKAAELVEPAYLTPGLRADKFTILRKLAEAYDRHVQEPTTSVLFAGVAKAAATRLPDETVETLRKMPIKEAMAFLTDRGTFLGPEAFCRYAMGPKSAEYAEVGPHATQVGRIAVEAIKAAAWFDKFDFVGAGCFDIDRFTSRPSRRFTDVLTADAAVKAASFAEDNLVDLIAASERGWTPAQKTAEAPIDAKSDLWLNTVDKPILATALKYAEYKVAALNAAFNGASPDGASNTNNRDALLALVAAQDL